MQHDLKFVWSYLIRSCRTSSLKFWLCWLFGIFFSTALILPFEPGILSWIRGDQLATQRDIAVFLAVFGKFHYFNLIGTLVLICIAYARNDRWLRRVAISFMLASTLSATVVQSVKPLVGRPRPSTCKRENVSYLHAVGPTLKRGYNSFPSGHTTTTAAGCAVIAIAFPRLIIPCILFALSMAWARIYTNSHFPTDVFDGAVIGCLSAYLTTRWIARPRRLSWRLPYSMRSQPIPAGKINFSF